MFALFPVQGKVKKYKKLDDLEHLSCLHVAQAMLFLEYVHTDTSIHLLHSVFRLGEQKGCRLRPLQIMSEPVITASLWNHTVAQNVFVHLKAVTRTQSDRMKRKCLVWT